MLYLKNHTNSILFIITNYVDVGIEKRYDNKILKELSNIYARIMNHYKFKYHTLFSASFL